MTHISESHYNPLTVTKFESIFPLLLLMYVVAFIFVFIYIAQFGRNYFFCVIIWDTNVTIVMFLKLNYSNLKHSNTGEYMMSFVPTLVWIKFH